MNIKGAIYTWSGKKVNIVDATPNIDVGFGLRNYRRKFLTKVVSFLVWFFNDEPEAIIKNVPLRGVRFAQIAAEFAPMYYLTFERYLSDDILTNSLRRGVENRWIRREALREDRSRYVYYPTQITVDRIPGWKNYYWKGLENRFAPKQH